MSKPNTVLVTGCAGFIGSNFVSQFKKQFPKTTIVGVDNFATGKREALDKTITFYEASITDPEKMEKVFAKHKPEYVFHFAALPRVSYSIEQPAETTLTNVYGTINLLEKARGHKVKRFIFSSSSAIYGGAKKLPTKEVENIPNPTSIYGLQKLVVEPFCVLFSQLYDLDTVSLRYFNVYGPGQYGDSPYSTVISAWLEKLYFPTGGRPFIEGNGSKTRDFCYVDNVVQANIRAMQAKGKLKGQVFNVAHGERTSIKQIRKELELLTGRKLDLEQRADRLGDVRHTHADISQSRRVLGYKPNVGFSEGLKRTVAWFEGRRQ